MGCVLDPPKEKIALLDKKGFGEGLKEAESHDRGITGEDTSPPSRLGTLQGNPGSSSLSKSSTIETSMFLQATAQGALMGHRSRPCVTQGATRPRSQDYIPVRGFPSPPTRFAVFSKDRFLQCLISFLIRCFHRA